MKTPKNNSSNKRLVFSLIILLFLMLLYLLLPVYKRILEKHQQIDQLALFLSTETNSANLIKEEREKQVRIEEQIWRSRDLTYNGLDSDNVGTKLIDTIQAYGLEIGFQIDSALLLPSYSNNNHTTISANVRGNGSPGVVLTFIELISNSTPLNIIEYARFNLLENQRMQLELRVSTLLTDTDDFFNELAVEVFADAPKDLRVFHTDFNLFGTRSGIDEPSLNGSEVSVESLGKKKYTSMWHVKGLIYSSNTATAILSDSSGNERIVQVNDYLSNEKVVLISQEYVILEHQNAYATLQVAP